MPEAIELKDIQKQVSEVKDVLVARLADQETQNTLSVEKVEAIKKEIDTKFDNLKEDIDGKIRDAKRFSLPGVNEEKQKFSWGKAFKLVLADYHNVKDEDIEKECAFEREVYNNMRGLGDNAVKRVAQATGNTGVGFLIPTELSSEFVDLALASMPLWGMVRKITGVNGNLTLPVLKTRPDAESVSEGGAPSEIDYTWDERTFNPKRVSGYSRISNQSMFQSSFAIESIIRDQIMKSMQIKVHKLLVKGTGTNKEPAGITTFSSLFTASNVTVSGNRCTVEDLSKATVSIEEADHDVTVGNWEWLMRPRTMLGLKTERIGQYSGDTNGEYVFSPPMISDQQIKDLAGYGMMKTTHLDNTAGKSSSIFGDWTEFIVPIWEQFTLDASNQASDSSGNSAFLQDETWIRANMYFDSNVGDPTRFTEITDCGDGVTATW